MKDTPKDFRLVSIEGENVRTLNTIAVRLDGKPGLFRATGDNGAGKTTLLDIVAMLFGGNKAVKSETIQEGKDGAWCRATLSNGYAIEKRFTPAAPEGYLTITTPDGMMPKGPQTLLNGWCGPRSVDPGALLRKKTAEIEAIILGLGKDPDLEEKRATLAARLDKLAEERRPWNSAKQRIQRLSAPTGTRPEPVDVSWEMERLTTLRTIQKQRDEIGRDVVALDLKAAGMEGRLERLKAEIQRLSAEREAVAVEWKDTQAAMKEQEKRLEAIEDPAGQIEGVEARIFEAQSINAELEPWKEWDRSRVELERAEKESDALTSKIKELKAEDDALLRAADIPVPGISFDESGAMLLDGHSIEVASGRRRLDLAVDVAFAVDPRIKIVLLDEANDYSLEALEALDKRAKDKGWQVIACRLGLEGPGEIVVHDGKALTKEVA